MAIVDVTRIAAFLNLTPRRIQQLVKEGMPREANGHYDPIKCALFYIRYLQNAIGERAEPTISSESVGERAARVRLLRAQADLKEMELATVRSQLVTVEDVEKVHCDLVRVTTARIMAIPPRLAPELIGETSRIMVQAKIERAFHGAFRLLARSFSNVGGGGMGPKTSTTKSQ